MSLLPVASGEPVGGTATLGRATSLSPGTLRRCLQREYLRVWRRSGLLCGHGDPTLGVPGQGTLFSQVKVAVKSGRILQCMFSHVIIYA